MSLQIARGSPALPEPRSGDRSHRSARALAFALGHRKAVIGSAVGLLVLSLLAGARMGRECMPSLDEGDVALHALRIPGTSLTQAISMQASLERALRSVPEVAKTFALFRLIHPRAVIKFAAGRETVMKDFQALLMLSGANGLLTGGYLTTRGRETSEDTALLAELSRFGDDGGSERNLPR